MCNLKTLREQLEAVKLAGKTALAAGRIQAAIELASLVVELELAISREERKEAQPCL